MNEKAHFGLYEFGLFPPLGYCASSYLKPFFFYFIPLDFCTCFASTFYLNLMLLLFRACSVIFALPGQTRSKSETGSILSHLQEPLKLCVDRELFFALALRFD